MQHANNKGTIRQGDVKDSDSVRLLELCADQIKVAIDEAFHEIDALSCSVLDSGRHARALLNGVDDPKRNVNGADDLVLADSHALQKAVNDATTRLQFADRLHQRLSNISKNLVGLAKLTHAKGPRIANHDWAEFLKEARATYTMEQERQMFDAVFEESAAANGAEPAMVATQDATLFEGDVRDGK